jgi:hypothetical protein
MKMTDNSSKTVLIRVSFCREVISHPPKLGLQSLDCTLLAFDFFLGGERAAFPSVALPSQAVNVADLIVVALCGACCLISVFVVSAAGQFF